jgi:AcrR family transcriptional regulator
MPADGMATLYRNFPSRRDLLEALYTDEVNAICEAARTVDGATPGDALLAWLHRFFAFFNTKRHVGPELLKDSEDNKTLFNDSRGRVLAAGRPLLVAAQRAHEVRDDLMLEQVLDMVIAVSLINGDGGYLEPILDTGLNGLRPS